MDKFKPNEAKVHIRRCRYCGFAFVLEHWRQGGRVCCDSPECQAEHREHRRQQQNKSARDRYRRIRGITEKNLRNWDNVRKDYNNAHNTDYSTFKELLEALYKRMGSIGVGKELGISYQAVLYRLKQYDIPIRPRGGSRGKRGPQAPIFKKEN